MRKSFMFFLMMITCFSVVAGGKAMKLKKSDQKKLKKMLSGSFNNELQAKEDKNFPHTILHITPIWKDEINGCWFYAEQALAATPDVPTAQKVYYLYKKSDTAMELKMYALRNANQVSAAWKDESKIAAISIDSLIETAGCAVLLNKRNNKVYSGHTDWGACSNSEKGATYASTEMVIYKHKLVIWERGWNDKDKQVWGSVRSGYSYIKKKKK